MRLVDDDYLIGHVDVEGFSRVLLQKKIVRQRHQLVNQQRPWASVEK